MKHLHITVVLFCLSAAIAHAQPTVDDVPYWKLCDTCFAGFDIHWADTLRFHIGVENMPHTNIA